MLISWFFGFQRGPVGKFVKMFWSHMSIFSLWSFWDDYIFDFRFMGGSFLVQQSLTIELFFPPSDRKKKLPRSETHSVLLFTLELWVNFAFWHFLELSFLRRTLRNVSPISVRNPLWALSLSFLSITLYELLVSISVHNWLQTENYTVM